MPRAKVTITESLFSYNGFSPMITYLYNNYRMITSVKEISERFYISKFYLSRIFKEATGFTLVEYITSLKIQQACQMLLDTDLTVLEIGLSCGFNSAEHFSKTFKKNMFISPRDFREKRM